MERQQKRELFASLSKQAANSHPLVKKIKVISANYTPATKTLVIHNKKSVLDNVEEIFTRIAEESIVVDNDAKQVEVVADPAAVAEFPETLKVGMYFTNEFPFIVSAKRNKERLSEVYKIGFDFKILPGLHEQHADGRYYEGILQIRNADEEVTFEALRLIDQEGNVVISRHSSPDQLSKDFFVTYKRPLKKIARLLQEKFGGTVKITAKIHTLDHLTQKDVFRDTVLFYRFGVRAGDIVKDGKDIFLVERTNRQVELRNVATAKKEVRTNDDGLVVIPWKKGSVVQQKPLLILDDETHETLSGSIVLDNTDTSDKVAIARPHETLTIVGPITSVKKITAKVSTEKNKK